MQNILVSNRAVVLAGPEQSYASTIALDQALAHLAAGGTVVQLVERQGDSAKQTLGLWCDIRELDKAMLDRWLALENYRQNPTAGALATAIKKLLGDNDGPVLVLLDLSRTMTAILPDNHWVKVVGEMSRQLGAMTLVALQWGPDLAVMKPNLRDYPGDYVWQVTAGSSLSLKLTGAKGFTDQVIALQGHVRHAGLILFDSVEQEPADEPAE